MASPPRRRAPTRYDRKFHDIREEYRENSLKKALARGSITEEDAGLISAFVAEMLATRGISIGRANKIAFTLVRWRDFIGPFKGNTIAQLHAGINQHNRAEVKGGRPYRRNTLHGHVRFLKVFYLWLIENGYSPIDKARVGQIRPPSLERMTKTAAQLLTEEEVRAMIAAAHNSRDRAILALQYDGAFRIQEVATLPSEEECEEPFFSIIRCTS